MKSSYNIVLASKSPRRSSLLTQMGFSFENRTKDVEESYPAALPADKVALYISEKKAAAFKSELKENELIITADTVVVYDNQVLGKPVDDQEAFTFIKSMSHNSHDVYTGVTILTKDKKISFSDRSIVHFSEITDEEIHFYIKEYNPSDKAGAYGIQEWIGHNFIHKIEGSYTNIMGLPTEKLYRTLKSLEKI